MEKPVTRFYQGTSMLGTFKPGDQLAVRLTGLDRLKPGDIILFRKDGAEIVHRIVAVDPAGLATRGDNNSFADADLVRRQDVVGLVTGYERGGRVYPAVGGKPGLFRLIFLRFWYRIMDRLVLVGHYPYRWLRERRLVALFWRPKLTKIQLKTENGLLVKYVHKQRTIARWWPEKHTFECNKPYDLVIPNPEETQST